MDINLDIENLSDLSKAVGDLMSKGASVDDAVALMKLYFQCKSQALAVRTMDLKSESDVVSTGLSTSTRSSRRRARRLGYLEKCDKAPDERGYCYLRMVKKSMRLTVRARVGAFPNLYGIFSLYAESLDMEALTKMKFSEVGLNCYHLVDDDEGGALAILRRTLGFLKNFPCKFRELIGEDESEGEVLSLDFKFGGLLENDGVLFEGVDHSTVATGVDTLLLDEIYQDGNVNFVVAPRVVSQREMVQSRVHVIEDSSSLIVAGEGWHRFCASEPSVLRFRHCRVDLADGRRYFAQESDLLVWNDDGGLSFNANFAGDRRGTVVVYVMKKVSVEDEYGRELKRRLAEFMARAFSKVDDSFRIPRDVATLFGMVTVSAVEDSVKMISSTDVGYSGTILVMSPSHVLLARKEYPLAKVYTLLGSQGLHWEQVLLRLYPDTISGDRHWYDDCVLDSSKLIIPDGAKTYVSWATELIRFAVTRHLVSLSIQDAGLDQVFRDTLVAIMIADKSA